MTEGPGWLEGRRPVPLLLAAGLLLYAHTLSFGLVWFDDNTLVLKAFPLLSDAANLPRLFFSDVFLRGGTFYYRPLLNLSFMLDAAAGGPPFFVFHLANVVLHAACGALLFLVLEALGAQRLKAFLLALAFLCHPALAEAAAWLPGRNDSLLFLFCSLAFLALRRYAARGGALSFAGYLAALAAALLTKESAAVLPFVLAGWLALVREEPLPRRSWAFFGAGSAAALAGWLAARWAAAGAAPWTLAAAGANAAGKLKVFLLLLGQAVLPLQPGVWPADAARYLPYGLAAAGLLAAAARLGRPGRAAWFGLAWFAAFTWPALGTADNFGILFWEHRLYLPLAGLLIFVSGLGRFRDLDLRRPVPLAACAALPLALALTAFPFSRHFSGRLAFWERAAQEAPANFAARLNLARAQEAALLYGPAEGSYREALRLAPGYRGAHNELGIFYARRGRSAAAAAEFEAELRLFPGDAAAGGNLDRLRSGRAAAGDPGRGNSSLYIR